MASKTCCTQCIKKCCPKLSLSSVIDRQSFCCGIHTSISKDGSKVYCVYGIYVTPTTTLSAELFDNINGTLVSSKTIQGDPNSSYVSVDGGQASKCFTKFSLLDDDNTSVARIRIFDNNLAIISTKIFGDYVPYNCCTFTGGAFSDDNCMVAVTYVNNAQQPCVKSVLRVLEVTSLIELASYSFIGFTKAVPRFFTLKCKNQYGCMLTKQYIVLPVESGLTSSLRILCIQGSNITLVDEVGLPAECTYDIQKIGTCVFIVVGTQRATVPGEVSVHKHTAPTALENDGNEYRVYKFDCASLDLMCSKNFDATVHAKFYPNSNCVVLNHDDVFELTQLDECLCPVKCASTLSKVAVDGFDINFSCDGNWGIVTGSGGDVIRGCDDSCSDNDSDCDLFNIQLYKVCQ